MLRMILAYKWENNTFIPHCFLSKTLQIYYHFQTRIPSAPVSKPSKSLALIPIFLPKTSIRRIALLLLLPLGANLFLQRWKLSVPTKLLTHSQWRCQFSRPRHCGLDNLIGEARRCVPGRGIQMLYRCLSQCWLLSCCWDSRFNSPPRPCPPILPSPLHAGGGDATQTRAPERALCWEGGRSLVASKSQSGCSGEVQGRRVNLHRHYLEVVLGAGTKLVSR